MPTLDVSQIAVWSFHTLLPLSVFYVLAMAVQHHWQSLEPALRLSFCV